MKHGFLEAALNPKSVVIVGASKRQGSLGTAVTKNILDGSFAGDITLVNPKYDLLFDRECLWDIGDVSDNIDLAVVSVPPTIVLDVVASLAEKHTKAAVIITAGLPDQAAVAEAAQRAGMRLFGSNCLGLLLPHVNLNASFAHLMPKSGGLAFLSQSGAILTSVIDWAYPKNIGFSHLLSLGNELDVDIATMLDYLADQPEVSAILIYMEAIKDADAFMRSAHRAAVRKPVIVLKVGRHGQAAKAVMSHTGALAGSDEVYEAAFRQVGIIRAETLEDLFDAGELLAREKRRFGNRLAIITNGGGLGIIATDSAAHHGVLLPSPSEKTIEELDMLLPSNWSRSNPIDIIGDATPERYVAALEVVLKDESFDAVLVINCPTAIASNIEIAEHVKRVLDAKSGHKPVLTNWAGDETASAARDIFEAAGIPTFETAEDAVSALSLLVRYARRQERLQLPVKPERELSADARQAVADILATAKTENRTTLNESEAKGIIAASSIEVVPTFAAKSVSEVKSRAKEILKNDRFTACVVKIMSEDISHKSDAGGVVLDIQTAEEAVAVAKTMYDRITRSHPDAQLDGFTVQPMIKSKYGRELIVGIAHDETFGPVVMAGAGGVAVEVMNDKAIDLPPLDNRRAKELLERTRIASRLQAYRNVPAIDYNALCDAIVAISKLACSFPEIAELDINPFIADASGVIALDARIGIA